MHAYNHLFLMVCKRCTYDICIHRYCTYIYNVKTCTSYVYRGPGAQGRPPRGLGLSAEGPLPPPWGPGPSAEAPGGGHPHRLGPPPPPWGPGGRGRRLGSEHIKMLYKAPKDYTKPQKTIQSPGILNKTLKYSKRIATNVNNRYLTYNIRYPILRMTYMHKKVLILIKRY